jgi:5-methylcytosine-specific restriction endonuclease McrA
MKDELIPYINDVDTLVNEMNELFQNRLFIKQESKNTKTLKSTLNIDQRQVILAKTDGLCHVCGCELELNDFQADHIKPHSQGGNNNINNFLASCSKCNNYRWNYSPEEIQWVLKLGVWLKTQIQERNETGLKTAIEFLAYETKRENRRSSPRKPKLNVKMTLLNLFPIKRKLWNGQIEATFEEIEKARGIISKYGIEDCNSNEKIFLKNNTFVISGESNLPRKEFENLILAKEGIVKKSISKNIDFLVIGNFYGLNKVYEVGKINSASDKKIKIITQSELIKYVC